MTLFRDVADLDPTHGVLIAGRGKAMSKTFPVADPANGRVIAEVADGTTAQATAAVFEAARSFAEWSHTAARARAEILRRAHDLMIAHADQLVGLICAENGKPQSDASAEVAYAAEFFRWYSEETVRTEGSYGPSPAGGSTTIVTHRPVGVAALVTPWNFPAAMVTRKVAPALAAGCTVVVKPAAETPLTALAVAKILSAAGVPDGVVNIVPTTDPNSVVDTWINDENVRALSFTGSTRVGKMLLEKAAGRVLNTSMELGGNAPFIVTNDADIDAAVAGAMIAKFRGGGQACTAANRFYIHTDVAAEFIDKFATATRSLRVGPASDPASQIGPLISLTAADAVRQLIAEAVADGAHIAYPPPQPAPSSRYVSPTLLVGVPPNARILHQEIFGPVAPIVTWSDVQLLRNWIANTEYGLAAYVYSRDLQAALRLAHATEAGMVGINRGVVSDPSAPFGGTKQSGLGREGARDGLREFQETQYFSVADAPY